jgi:D-alanine-D-alanine ligase
MPERLRLVVLFGGQSAEHDVSCTTAVHVLAAADPERYELAPVGITRDGKWVVADEALAALAEGTHALPDRLRASGPSTDLLPAVTGRSDQQVVVLPLLHGPLGEDGTVQGLLELAGVPYVGSGVLGSAVAMDKAMAKDVLARHGIPQARWRTLHEPEITAALLDDVAAELGVPCFVKPANMGSSVGVSKAHDRHELDAAVALALVYDEWVVVEEAVTGREIELSVLGNHEVRVSVPGEIVPGAEFYDYADKYESGSAQLVIPAELPAEVVSRLQELSVAAYRALRLEGMARADFLYEEGGRGPLLNELNTIPGFTPISMYPKLWEASGLAYGELIDELVTLALERHARRVAKRVTSRSPRAHRS